MQALEAGKIEQEWVTTEIELPGKTVVSRYGMWPKQREFHTTRARYVVFGGARGPGKSYALCQHVYRAAVRWPGIPILLLRKDLQDLKLTTEKEWKKVVPYELYDPKYGGQHHLGEHWYRFPNGSQVYLGQLKDWESYKSATMGMVAIDELNEVEEEAYLNMDPVLRWTTGEGVCEQPECKELGEEFVREHPVHPFYQIVACTNPAPGWVKTKFWDPWKEGRERPNHRFIAATAYDNPSLPPDFIPRLLESHTETWVRNYIHGDWSSFENMAWPRWSRAVHMWKGPVPFEQFARIEGGIDYGATTATGHRTCAYLAGWHKAGFPVTFWEYSKQGAASGDFFEAIASAQKMYKPWRWKADASQHRANELLREANIPVYDAPRYQGAVKDGINLIDRLMAQSKSTGRPGLYVTENCERLMSGIETYQIDAATGQPLKNQEDDEVNAWRYCIDGITEFAGTPSQDSSYVVHGVSGTVAPKASRMITQFREERRARLRNAMRSEV